jgi:hypothetical protein
MVNKINGGRGLNDVIIANERDRLTLAYLVKIRPANAIQQAINDIHPNKKVYVSNIIKALGVEVPEHIYHVATDPKPYLENLKKLLNK